MTADEQYAAGMEMGYRHALRDVEVWLENLGIGAGMDNDPVRTEALNTVQARLHERRMVHRSNGMTLPQQALRAHERAEETRVAMAALDAEEAACDRHSGQEARGDE